MFKRIWLFIAKPAMLIKRWIRSYNKMEMDIANSNILVTWTSQAGGNKKEKTGRLLVFMPANADPRALYTRLRSIPSSRIMFDGKSSIDRYLVEVPKTKGTGFVYYAPAAAVINKAMKLTATALTQPPVLDPPSKPTPNANPASYVPSALQATDTLHGFTPGSTWRCVRPRKPPFSFIVLQPGGAVGSFLCRLAFDSKNPLHGHDSEVEFHYSHLQEHAVLEKAGHTPKG